MPLSIDMSELLKKALTVDPRRPSDPGRHPPYDAPLAIAWLQGNVSGAQVSAAMGGGRQSYHSWIAISLREAYRDGKLVVKKGKKP